MITLLNFTIGYGQRILLQDVNAEIADGRLTALIGRNGTGKSTLLRAIAGMNRQYTGEILINGTAIAAMSHEQMARTISIVTTERIRIGGLNCRDVVAAGRAPYTNWIGRLTAADRRAVYEALDAVGMREYADRTIDRMSDGECQRVMIARALAQDTPVILLDEPTSFLDMPTRYELCTLLHDLAAGSGKCILFSTHELDIALNICDSVALIDPPGLSVQPSVEMACSEQLRRLFSLPGKSTEFLSGIM